MSTAPHVATLAERIVSAEALESSEALDAVVETWLASDGAELIAVMREQDVALVPTLVASEAITRAVAPDSDVWEDVRLSALSEEQLESWRNGLRADLLPPDFHRQRLAIDAAGRKLVGAFHAAGVRVLPGTDCGAPHVYWGASMADELEALVESGLTPLEALGAATHGAAELLGLDAVTGAIEVGFAADLVLLGSDPREDVGAVRDLRLVLARGEVLRP